MQESQRELDFTRFCSYSVSQVLGVGVQGEYLYIVQSQKISVFEYHGRFDRPQLAEELIHNTPILDYALSMDHIALRSNSTIQLRHRKHWEQLVLTRPLSHPENYLFLALDHHSLYLASSDSSNLLIEKIDVESKAVTAVINLGRLPERGGEWVRRLRPILLGEMGSLNDFYIWAKSPQEVELGMLYTNSGSGKRKFEINQITVPQGKILQVYHHRVQCPKYPKQSPEYVILIIQKEPEPQLYLQLYQIMPRQHPKRTQDPASDFHGQFQNILNQFSFLKNLNQKSSPSSLVQEVLSEAIADVGPKVRDPNIFQVCLQGMSSCASSFYGGGKLWVVSDKRVCQIQLVSQQSIEVIVKSYRSEMKVIRSITYKEKPVNKHCLALYQDTLLFSEITTSFDIAAPRAQSEEIAEEIETYEINDEILEKEAEIRITSQAERLRQDFLKLKQGLQEEEKEEMGLDDEGDSYQEEKRIQRVQSSTQTDQPPQKQFIQCSIQTAPLPQSKPIPIGLQQMQQLVAKYSSAFTVACGKVKQNHYLKDKFDREIFNIVDSVVKDSVQPFLEGRFIALLDEKVKEISQQISTVFQGQLEALNQLMRRDEVKENNLRGRRIFEFANQVAYIRDTVTSLTDALKANEIHKHSFNSLILEQTKEMREEITKVTTAIGQVESRWQASDKQMAGQVSEIFEMVRTLQERQRENAEDSASSVSEGSGQEQREIVQTSESGSDSSIEGEDREEVVHHRYPQHYPRGQEPKKTKKSFDGFDVQGYPTPYPAPEYYHAPPPPPPQMQAYYYPFMPSPHSVPMHGYYHRPNYAPFGFGEEVEKVQVKRRGKKSKKASD